MTNIIIAVFIITIFAFLLILIGRNLIAPLLFNPKLDFNKTYKYLDSQNCVFIEYKGIDKTEINKFKKDNTDYFDLLAFTSRFKVIAKVKDEKRLKIFWVEIKSWRSLFTKTKTEYIEETDIELIKKAEESYFNDIINTDDNCPACKSEIKQTDNICPDCGLYIK